MRGLIGFWSVVAALSSLGVACDSGTSATMTTPVVDDSPSSTTSSRPHEVNDWLDRIDGQHLSYRMVLECLCASGGEWRVAERDGVVIEAEYLGEGEPSDDVPWVVLSQALRLASTADGPVVVTDLTATSIRLQVDEDVSAVDDEFGFYASEISVGD